MIIMVIIMVMIMTFKQKFYIRMSKKQQISHNKNRNHALIAIFMQPTKGQ